MRFCQAFMSELFRHIGPNTDVPAGDIGVGGREIGFLFGQYKKLRNEFTGILTGKGLNWGGSLIRPEATGYGAVYFASEMLVMRDDTLDDKVCLVSGSGNVAQYTCEKLLDLGGKPVTLSDSSGYIYDEAGNRSRQARVGDGAEERAPWPHCRVRRRVRQRRLHGQRPECRPQPAVGSQGRLRLPVGDAERDQRHRRRQPAGQRCFRGFGGRQHADGGRGRQSVR